MSDTLPTPTKRVNCSLARVGNEMLAVVGGAIQPAGQSCCSRLLNLLSLTRLLPAFYLNLILFFLGLDLMPPERT